MLANFRFPRGRSHDAEMADEVSRRQGKSRGTSRQSLNTCSNPLCQLNGHLARQIGAARRNRIRHGSVGLQARFSTLVLAWSHRIVAALAILRRPQKTSRSYDTGEIGAGAAAAAAAFSLGDSALLAAADLVLDAAGAIVAGSELGIALLAGAAVGEGIGELSDAI